MMAPTNRLVVWVAVATLPATALAAVLPDVTAAAAAAATLLVLAAAVDAGIGWHRFRSVAVDLPGRVRLSKGRAGVLPVAVSGAGGVSGPLRVALETPSGLRCDPAILRLTVPRTAVEAGADWPLTAARIGRYTVRRGRVEALSPLGLWAVRRWLATRTELRVYPDLTAGRRDLQALWHNTDPGHLSRRLLGKGREFDHLREYLPGDSYEDIHWKATARHGHPVTKMYQLERIQQIYAVLDTSRLSARPPLSEAKGDRAPANLLEQYLTTALVLAMAAQRQGDLFGLVTASATVDTFIRAASGQAHLNRCREALYTLTPRPVAADFQELFTTIANRLHQRALVVILTSLDDPIQSETFLEHLDLVCRRHVVLICMPRPASVQPLFEQPVADVDGIYRQLAGHLAWHRLREVGRALERRGAGFCLLDSEAMAVPVVSSYLEIKQRQLI